MVEGGPKKGGVGLFHDTGAQFFVKLKSQMTRKTCRFYMSYQSNKLVNDARKKLY